MRAIQDIIKDENDKLELEVDNLKKELAEKDKRIKELEDGITLFLDNKMLEGCDRCSGWKLPCSACQRSNKKQKALILGVNDLTKNKKTSG